VHSRASRTSLGPVHPASHDLEAGWAGLGGIRERSRSRERAPVPRAPFVLCRRRATRSVARLLRQLVGLRRSFACSLYRSPGQGARLCSVRQPVPLVLTFGVLPVALLAWRLLGQMAEMPAFPLAVTVLFTSVAPELALMPMDPFKFTVLPVRVEPPPATIPEWTLRTATFPLTMLLLPTVSPSPGSVTGGQ